MYAYYSQEQCVYKHYLERIAYGITGKDYGVEFINDGRSIGYTSGDEPRTIYLAWRHPYYEKMSDDERKFFILGVFAHELLHQLYTDFDYTEKKIRFLMNESLASVFMSHANTLEDPAIEHRAPEAYGGTLLAALRFTIRKIYELSPGIEESGSAYMQYINALINLGDVGFVKGEFTYDEAYETFVKVAPLFCKGIFERSGKKRLDIASECMELSRPLWEKEIKKNEEMREALKELLKELMEHMGKTSSSANPEDSDSSDSESSDSDDSGAGDSDDSNLSDEEKELKNRMEKTLEKIKEAAEELKKDDEKENNSSDPSGNKGSEASEKDQEEQSPQDGKGGKESDEEAEPSSDQDNSSGKGEGNDEKSVDKSSDGKDSSDSDEQSSLDQETGSDNSSDQETDSDSSESNSSKENSSSETSKNQNDGDSGSDNSEGDNKVNNPSFNGEPMDKNYRHSFDISDKEKKEITEKEAEQYSKELFTAVKDLKNDLKNEEIKMNAEEEASKAEDELMDVEEKRSDGKEVVCTNVTAGDSRDVFKSMASPETYTEMVSSNRGKINRLSKSLKNIFEAEKEDNRRGTSGNYNILRGSTSTTSRIFDKRRDPGDKADTAVVVAIDCSGSMSYENRYLAARDTACIIGEALMNCNIPHYMFGFTADVAGEDAYHVHYVTWKNWKSRKAHENLAEIAPNSNNYDSYAVKYAGELLKKAPQKNKVLIVISDGLPAAYAYSSMREGKRITGEEIEKVKKFASVCGVAIGHDVDGEALQEMYGANFVQIENIDDFSNMVIKRFLKTIKGLR